MKKINLRAAVPGFTSTLQIAILSKEAANLVRSLYIVHFKESRMKQKILLLISVLTTAVIFFIGCNKSSPPTAPPPDVVIKDTVNIIVEDITHRSIAINVKSTANNSGWRVSLYRTLNGADTLVSFFAAALKDTIIIDDNNGSGLMLDTEYKYYAALTDTAGKLQEKTNTVTAKTLAPTNHNYTWQEYIIGDVGIQSSILYDVWGTDENNVWAVGGVQINGTSYGVLHWNGNEWIPDSTAGGYAIYGFNNSDVWTVGGGVFHYDGVKWNRIDGYSSNGQGFPLDSVLFYSMPYTSIWGTSSNNLYLGSGWGKIIHWDGKKASIVFSTDLTILDIWGTNDKNIYAAAGSTSQYTGRLFHYEGSEWKLIRTGGRFLSSSDTEGPFTSVWGTKNNELFLQAKYIEARLGGNWQKEELCPYWMHGIAGTNTNNIFACGDRGVLKHFNGIDWMTYEGLTNRPLSGIYTVGNKIFAVGDRIILIGTNY